MKKSFTKKYKNKRYFEFFQKTCLNSKSENPFDELIHLKLEDGEVNRSEYEKLVELKKIYFDDCSTSFLSGIPLTELDNYNLNERESLNKLIFDCCNYNLG